MARLEKVGWNPGVFKGHLRSIYDGFETQVSYWQDTDVSGGIWAGLACSASRGSLLSYMLNIWTYFLDKGVTPLPVKSSESAHASYLAFTRTSADHLGHEITGVAKTSSILNVRDTVLRTWLSGLSVEWL